MGYQGISPSIAFEFDTYENSGNGDLATDHFAVHTGGDPSATGRLGNNIDLGNLEDSVWHDCIIDWNHSTKTITVTFDGIVIYTLTRDIVNLDFGGNPIVSFGFTASTGAAYNEQAVCVTEVSYVPCQAGAVSPILSTTTACGGSTVDLNSLVTSTTPSGATLVWFTNDAHTGAAYTTPTTATVGTYYAFYYDATNDCYSPASAVINVLSNFPSGGIIISGEANCSSFDPLEITEFTSAGGGSAEYIWEQSTDGGATWTVIPGATTISYDPTFITQTVEYRRGVRRYASCSYMYSNTIVKEVSSLIGIDSDNDGISDQCDLDDDNDGILDEVECPSDFYYVNWSNISGNTATGTINGVNVTYTSNQTINESSSIFAYNNFPTAYNIPNGPRVIQNTQVTTNTLSFGTPVANPILIFSSIGQSGNSVPISFSNQIEILWSQSVVQDSPTQITGTEGYVIVRIPGTFSNLSFDYLVAEVSCDFVFGRSVDNCVDIDNDGINNRLDLDSDNDGCIDAIEGTGGFSIADTQNDTLTGGVDANGVPIVANGGQGMGSSQIKTLLPTTVTNITSTNPTCGQSNGSITIQFNDDVTETHIEFSLDGGISFQTAVLDNSGSVTYSNLSEGTYNIYSRFQDGVCSKTEGIQTLINTGGPSVTASNDQNICAGESVTLSVNATGGTGTKTYQWNDNTGASVGTGASISVNPASTMTYSAIATDQIGCIAIDMVTVTVRDLPTATFTKTDPTSSLNNGSIMITYPDHPTETQIQFSLDGGTTYQSVVLDNSSQTTYANLASGSYTIYARWGNSGCPVLIGSVNLVNSGAPVVAIEDTTICNGTSIILQTTASAGMSPYSFSWSNGF